MPAVERCSEPDRPSLYAEVTGRIVHELEQGRVPWVQPWGRSPCPLGLPRNAATGRRYSGINILILWDAAVACGFPSQNWLTYRQAVELGGHVRKGERGTTVVYADRFVPQAERERAEAEDDEPAGVPFLKRFTVFNAAQCEGLPERVGSAVPMVPDDAIVPEADALIEATGADIRIGGDRALYVPSEDFIRVPPRASFFAPINWYRTCFHELGHWTGHPSRLARDFSGAYGSVAYGREELVAEMASAFVCASLGIVPTVRHADYLGAWLELLREDTRAIFRAASHASRAADFILETAPCS
ncbi:ArdC family protein [Inquilinus limosus]|uniref:ArdC family protein n=1 Tax=Inquilinus limosus TaxID=171674 RepID=UPI00042A2D6D|nr:zincin-like metallopeptidase domain-containing protein [Inquilinus limosus]